MKRKLSLPSRILVALASLLLVAVFFFPAWRIDLFAPQYPEGLTMNIWINGLSGEVDVINGLNHYIGMQHITVAMFPEFQFLPYVVVFFMLMGLLVAWTGKRRFLFAYLVLTVIGGVAAMVDFYKWGYNYGHHLDPTAPIQVPGLAYQPPLFGHKRILNFDAYSFPDVGGWIVIGAGTLAFAVWFYEWWRHHKEERIIKPVAVSALLPFLSVLLLLTSCSRKPEPIQYGKDNCDFCKMGMADPKYGAEIVTQKGKIYKFDDISCMLQFVKTGGVDAGQISKYYVINTQKENDLLDASSASFLKSENLKSPMGSHTAAYPNPDLARSAATSAADQVLSWEELQKILAP